MQTIKARIAERIVESVKMIRAEAELESTAVVSMLEYPPDPTMGDLAFPCFKLSRLLRTSPVQIAQRLTETLSDGCISRVEAVNGYLNITISNEYLATEVVPEILEKREAYG